MIQQIVNPIDPSHNDHMQQFVGTSLKTRLYLLVLAAFIPVAVLIIFVTEEQKRIETDAILHKTMLLARAAADAENQQMESIRNLLVVVADALLMVDGQADRLAPLLANLPRQTDGYAAVGVVDIHGHLMAGSDPSQMAKDYMGQTWFSASLMKQRMTMDRYHGERINGVPVLYFAQPVIDTGHQVVAVAFAALSLDWMTRAIIRQLAELPKGSQLTLLDKIQGMLRFDVDTQQWAIPQPFDADLQKQIVSRPSGALEAVDENGTLADLCLCPVGKRFQAAPRFSCPGNPQINGHGCIKTHLCPQSDPIGLIGANSHFFHLVGRQCLYPEAGRRDGRGQPSACRR